jgi:hypothetical protein
LEIASVILDAIGDVGFVGVPEPDEIGSEATDVRCDVRNHVPPKIGGRGIAMQE